MLKWMIGECQVKMTVTFVIVSILDEEKPTWNIGATSRVRKVIYLRQSLADAC